MNDYSGEPLLLQDITRERLESLRSALLYLHKTLLDLERGTYERAYGRVTAGDLLKLVIQHPQFAWLHSISELIVRIDELLDVEEQPEEAEAVAMMKEIHALLGGAESDAAFTSHYRNALQHDPAAVLAHRAATSLLPTETKRLA